MKISRFTVNVFCENTYVLWQNDGGDAIIVDPGMTRQHEIDAVENFIEEHSLHVTHILLTHAHLDHIFAAQREASHYSVKVHASRGESDNAASLPQQAMRFGMKKLQPQPLVIDSFLEQGDTIMLGDEPIEVLETPGHTPGGLSFYLPQSEVVLTGDTLFNGSIGRTDLPGGDFDTLITSIRTQLLTLPPTTLIAPGHDDTSTIGDQIAYNPYLH